MGMSFKYNCVKIKLQKYMYNIFFMKIMEHYENIQTYTENNNTCYGCMYIYPRCIQYSGRMTHTNFRTSQGGSEKDWPENQGFSCICDYVYISSERKKEDFKEIWQWLLSG